MHFSEGVAAVWSCNSDKGLFPQPPVYALLTDLNTFTLFKFDGNSFTMQDLRDGIAPLAPKRADYLFSMMTGKILKAPLINHPHRALVAERIFSVMLDGLIAHLGAVRDKSQRRGEEGDVNYTILPLALHS
jgi:hypothetical protein